MAGLRQQSQEPNPVWLALSAAYSANPALIASLASTLASPPHSGSFIVYFHNGLPSGWEIQTVHKERDFAQKESAR